MPMKGLDYDGRTKGRLPDHHLQDQELRRVYRKLPENKPPLRNPLLVLPILLSPALYSFNYRAVVQFLLIYNHLKKDILHVILRADECYMNFVRVPRRKPRHDYVFMMRCCYKRCLGHWFRRIPFHRFWNHRLKSDLRLNQTHGWHR